MLHKASNSKEEMPYCFPRLSIKFQGHTGQNITDFDPNWAFPDYRPVAAFKSLRFALFKVIREISRSHGSKNCFWPKLGVSGLELQFEFTNGYEMMHKAWSSIEKVPYCFSRSSVEIQGHTGWKIANFDPNWAFPDSDFSLNSLMALKWCIKLEGTYKSSPIVSQGHPSNFKFTWDNKSPILTRIERFRTVSLVWILWWLWNNAQSLKQHRIGAPIVFQGHPSNFKVKQDKKSPILTRIECFPTVNPVWIHQGVWDDAQSLT